MTESPEDTQLAYADRIAKLLRKAEATDSQHEADALTAKAQQLMRKYAITEALISAASGAQVQDTVVEERITYTGIYHRALYDIGAAVARNSGCKVLIGGGGKTTTLYVIGFSSDVSKVKVLDSSVQIQAVTAMGRWWRTQDSSWMSQMDKFKARREFFFGFAQGLSARLAEANRTAKDEAVVEYAAAHSEQEATVRTSTELVLRTRDEQVKDWMDKTYGKLRSRRSARTYGGGNASSAGRAAGRSADVGATRLGGTRGAIGGR